MRAGAAREVCVVGGGATQDARETRNKCASKNLCEQKVRAKMCEQKVPQFKPKLWFRQYWRYLRGTFI